MQRSLGRPVSRAGGDFEHAFDGEASAAEDGVGELDAGSEIFHAITDFFERIHFHVFAFAAVTGIGRGPHGIDCGSADELFVGTFLLHAMEDSRFGYDNKLACRARFAVGDHFLGRADDVSEVPDLAKALGMDDDFGVGKLEFNPRETIAAELDVGVTVSPP